MLGTRTFTATRQHSYLQARHRHLLYLPQRQMKTSPIVPLHIQQTVWGCGEPPPGDKLNLAPGMCSPCRGAHTLTRRVQLPVSECLLDDTLQMVQSTCCPMQILRALSESYRMTSALAGVALEFFYFRSARLAKISLMNPPLNSLSRTTSKLQCTSTRAYVGRGASGCSGF